MARRLTLLCTLTAMAAFFTSGMARATTPVATPMVTPTAVAIDPANFTTSIDNPYFPLKPGTRFIYEGTADGASSRDEMTVLAETKTIMGVECVVVRDVAFEDGEMVEDTRDWYAQDREGNVWYFGEDTETVENGQVTGTEGSWEAGVDGAQAGIIMPANPSVGEPYFQEYAPGVAEDMAEVILLSENVTVPYGSFSDVLVTREWSPLEPDVVEEKSYAPGIGDILENSVQGENDHLELVDIQTVPATPTT
jgi:hypothetical protein